VLAPAAYGLPLPVRHAQVPLIMLRIVYLCVSVMTYVLCDSVIVLLKFLYNLIIFFTLFCNKHGIQVPSMDGNYVLFERSSQFSAVQTNDDHFRRQVYIGIIDRISQELDTEFDEVNMELLSCTTTLHYYDHTL
jgi:hypothetical protein